ncbi:MAG: SLC13 family permease [Oscillospiraceae bacterium]|nr:SLC13 family permease [Oscillospiraceae bacterium]
MTSTTLIMLIGIFITLFIWIFKPFKLPYAVGGLFLAVFALVIGLSPAVVFSGFSGAAVWTLIPALFFGFVLQKTGLGKRIALGIIKIFKPSYPSLVLAWVLIGIVLSMMTPSITVRVAIVIPIALQCCELCKLQKGSKGNSLILLTAFAMALIPGSGWLSGLLAGPIVQNMYSNAGLAGMVTFGSWFEVLFLPMMIITVLTAVGGLLLLKPKDKIPAEVVSEIKAQVMPKMTRHEIFSLAILSGVFVMFLTSSLHKIPDAAVCLSAVILFFVFGVIDSKEFNSGVNWDLVIFIGMAISLGAIFTETGISALLSSVIVPALAPIAGNPWLFMFGVVIFMFIWRFVDIAIFIPTMAIIIPILPDIQEAYNIHPLVWIPTFIFAANAFFMSYQNIWAMMSKSMSGDRAWSNKHLGLYGVVYFAACMLTLTIAIPMWISQGLF